MDTTLLLICLGTFSAVGLLTYGVFAYTAHRKELQGRFAKSKTSLAPMVRRESKGFSLKDQVLDMVSSFGKMSMGKEQKKTESSDLRITMIQAGFRYTNSVAVFYGIKALSTILFPITYLAIAMSTSKVSNLNLFYALGTAALGYYLPNLILRRALKNRQDRIDKALPDVLDLMIVSLEAGLSLQATLNHVAEEVRRISKDMHQELRVTNAELRTGIPRDNALKNLADRTGVQSVGSLTALMIQSEKMGASIAHSLRTHADFVRVQRGQRAEEMAAKMPIKIIFPTLFCIFPSIFIVILGPAAIQIYRNFITK